MARIRTIKPEFWLHPVMARLRPEDQLLALGLLTMADDHGFFFADPSVVRGTIAPFREDLASVSRGLSRLSEVGWIEVREHPEMGKIGMVCNWTKHQKVDHPSASKIKDYFLANNSRESREKLALEQGTGNREQGTTPPTPSRGEGKPKPKRRVKAPVDDLGVPPPPEVLEAVAAIVDATPKVDSTNREIRVVRGELLTRILRILEEHPSATPRILVLAWQNYLRSGPSKVKAPQYFFGRQEDQGASGANWYPFARAIFVARQQEVPRAATA